MRRLIVFRHAKSARPPGVADRDRPLADRGIRESGAAGRWLRGAGIVPDAVLCSTSARTRQTFELMAAELPGMPAADFDSRVYYADPDELTDLIAEAGKTADVVMVIGHNPALHELVGYVTGKMPDRFPPAAIAIIDLRKGARIGAGAGRLTNLWLPR